MVGVLAEYMPMSAALIRSFSIVKSLMCDGAAVAPKFSDIHCTQKAIRQCNEFRVVPKGSTVFSALMKSLPV